MLGATLSLRFARPSLPFRPEVDSVNVGSIIMNAHVIKVKNIDLELAVGASGLKNGILILVTLSSSPILAVVVVAVISKRLPRFNKSCIESMMNVSSDFLLKHLRVRSSCHQYWKKSRIDGVNMVLSKYSQIWHVVSFINL